MSPRASASTRGRAGDSSERPGRGQTAERARRRLFPALALAALLVVANLAVYGRSLQFGFVNLDDDRYVSKNPVVQQGLTAESLRWALTTVWSANWHPLTWLSHMLDCQIYGLSAGGHHLTSLLLHIATTLLLFFFWLRLRGGLGSAWLLAALFSLHPLRVESVVWIAERKDVLSGFFWMLSLWAYVLYLARPSRGRHIALLAIFALGLMSKSMLVTLPIVLLLLDLWPLGRLAQDRGGEGPAAGGAAAPPPPAAGSRSVAKPGAGGDRLRKADAALPFGTRKSFPGLVIEKLPLVALSIATGIVTLLGQRSAGSVRTMEQLPLGPRLANALLAPPRYIGKMLWPDRLAVLYPFGAEVPGWEVAASIVLLTGVTLLALLTWRHRGWLLTGWGWYLIVLLPVIGVVQVGIQSIADRYTYLPTIGLLIVLIEAPLDLWPRRAELHRTLAALGAAAVVVLGALSWRQVGYWRDSVTLFTHALAVTESSFVSEQNLAVALYEQGKIDEGMIHQERSLQMRPPLPDEHNKLGLALFNRGRIDEAIVHYRAEIARDPAHFEAHCNLGVALAVKNRFAEALKEFEEAVRLKPDYGTALYNIGLAKERLGDPDGAIGFYERSLAIDPANADCEYNLGMVLADRGRPAEAVTHLRRVLELQPRYPRAAEELRRVERLAGSADTRR